MAPVLLDAESGNFALFFGRETWRTKREEEKSRNAADRIENEKSERAGKVHTREAKRRAVTKAASRGARRALVERARIPSVTRVGPLVASQVAAILREDAAGDDSRPSDIAGAA
jgi:hypothetical protein